MHEAAMSDASRLALIPAFYLSKFDAAALSALRYRTFQEAFADIGQKLGVNPRSVKNKRDDFDPVFENARAGWHQRPLGPSRLKALRLLDELSFEALTGFVSDFLQDAAYRQSGEVMEVLDAMKKGHRRGGGRAFIPRGATGRMAEELFLQWFARGHTPFRGTLIDKREDGCGYDFLIQDENEEQLVEVKGIAGQEGGILLTDKEWQTAKKHRSYNLAVFLDLQQKPQLRIYKNPAKDITPLRSVRLTVQVSWQISPKQLAAKRGGHE